MPKSCGLFCQNVYTVVQLHCFDPPSGHCSLSSELCGWSPGFCCCPCRIPSQKVVRCVLKPRLELVAFLLKSPQWFTIAFRMKCKLFTRLVRSYIICPLLTLPCSAYATVFPHSLGCSHIGFFLSMLSFLALSLGTLHGHFSLPGIHYFRSSLGWALLVI